MKLRLSEDHELAISERADWRLFGDLAARLRDHFDGEWLAQLDGLDQRYWDLRVGRAVVTLHLEHHLGISLFPAQDESDREASVELVRRIAVFLASDS